ACRRRLTAHVDDIHRGGGVANDGRLHAGAVDIEGIAATAALDRPGIGGAGGGLDDDDVPAVTGIDRGIGVEGTIEGQYVDGVGAGAGGGVDGEGPRRIAEVQRFTQGRIDA